MPLAWFRRNQATGAKFSHFRLCAFSGNRGLSFSSRLVFPRLSRRPIRLQLSAFVTAVCEPVRSRPSITNLPLALGRRAVVHSRQWGK